MSTNRFGRYLVERKNNHNKLLTEANAELEVQTVSNHTDVV